ncbi:uncharacterized protein LOC134267491 [Saccostrea cucullata]|uniref:uncharacterized protein LOC134267491 n=1 Tax=Saccostrea cuccullata TaxID=36930 RepID=UPI002ED47D59
MTIGSLKIGNCCANVSHYDVHYDVHTTNNMADSITLCKQMEVLPHFDPSQTSDSWDSFLDYGDSGSFVFFISQEDPLILKCIGLAVAKTSYGSCLMTPIDKVLDALDLPHNCLSKFTPNVSHEETKADILSILNDLSRKIATKDDIEKLENEMHKINERLSATESEVIMLITEKTKEAS